MPSSSFQWNDTWDPLVIGFLGQNNVNRGEKSTGQRTRGGGGVAVTGKSQGPGESELAGDSRWTGVLRSPRSRGARGSGSLGKSWGLGDELSGKSRIEGVTPPGDSRTCVWRSHAWEMGTAVPRAWGSWVWAGGEP